MNFKISKTVRYMLFGFFHLFNAIVIAFLLLLLATSEILKSQKDNIIVYASLFLIIISTTIGIFYLEKFTHPVKPKL